MIVETLLFIVGLVLLVKGSDFFVESAATMAKKLGVTEFIIGLTVVALGTSIPELASSITAAVKGAGGIAIGNVVGSNIANIALIVGVAAVIRTIKISKEMLKRDGYIMVFATVLLIAVMLNSSINRAEGILFLVFYFAYIIFLFEIDIKSKKQYHFGEFLDYFYKFRYLTTIKSQLMKGISRNKKMQKKKYQEMFREGLEKDVLMLMISGAALIYGAKYLVESAIFFAKTFNIPESLIAISLIAIGTSLPELMVTITATRKGQGSIALGNVIGSNITNIFLVIGASATISPFTFLFDGIGFSTVIMMMVSVALLGFMNYRWKIDKYEGVILLVSYAIFITALFYYV